MQYQSYYFFEKKNIKHLFGMLFSLPGHEVLKVSYCGQPMFIVRHQQFALKTYSSYIFGPIDLKLGRKHLGDLFS